TKWKGSVTSNHIQSYEYLNMWFETVVIDTFYQRINGQVTTHYITEERKIEEINVGYKDSIAFHNINQVLCIGTAGFNYGFNFKAWYFMPGAGISPIYLISGTSHSKKDNEKHKKLILFG